MLAALPWYDFAEVQGHNDALWRRLQVHLGRVGLEIDAELERTVDPNALLLRPDLLLSQTCGYVVAGVGRAHVMPVATPTYAAPGCAPGSYSSFLIVRRDARITDIEDLRGARCAVNEPLSHSGVNALRTLVAPRARDGRFFGDVIVTGAHVASMELLARDQADITAVDCITHALLARHRPVLVAATKILEVTPLAAAPPLVTRATTSVDALVAIRSALQALLADPDANAARRELLLTGFELRPVTDYEGMLTAARRAWALGYREMSWPEVLANGCA